MEQATQKQIDYIEILVENWKEQLKIAEQFEYEDELDYAHPFIRLIRARLDNDYPLDESLPVEQKRKHRRFQDSKSLEVWAQMKADLLASFNVDIPASKKEASDLIGNLKSGWPERVWGL